MEEEAEFNISEDEEKEVLKSVKEFIYLIEQKYAKNKEPIRIICPKMNTIINGMLQGLKDARSLRYQ